MAEKDYNKKDYSVNPSNQKTTNPYMRVGLIVGLIIGTLLGLAFDRADIGIPFGTALGGITSMIINAKKSSTSSN